MIFGIGLNKTGTTSLHEACVLLGLRSSHDWQVSRDWLEHGGPIPDVDALWDGSVPGYCLALLETFPEARFILTTRPMKEWINSRIIHVLHNRVRGEQEWWDIDTKAWEREYIEHHERVRGLFAGRRNYMEMDVTAGDGWKQLCGFLGLPVPKAPFPRANTGRERLSGLMELMN